MVLSQECRHRTSTWCVLLPYSTYNNIIIIVIVIIVSFQSFPKGKWRRGAGRRESDNNNNETDGRNFSGNRLRRGANITNELHWGYAPVPARPARARDDNGRCACDSFRAREERPRKSARQVDRDRTNCQLRGCLRFLPGRRLRVRSDKNNDNIIVMTCTCSTMYMYRLTASFVAQNCARVWLRYAHNVIHNVFRYVARGRNDRRKPTGIDWQWS